MGRIRSSSGLTTLTENRSWSRPSTKARASRAVRDCSRRTQQSTKRISLIR